MRIFGKKLLQRRCFSKSDAGFTLIEILIVFSILGLLSTGLVLYGRQSEKHLLLFKDQARIIGSLQKAKSLSFGTYGQTDTPCGYGVNFSQLPKTFTLFKDLPAPGGTCAASADNRLTGPEETVESFRLDAGLEFDSLALTDIVFIPPAPTVRLSGGNPAEEVITIRISGTNETRRVKVTDFGQITSL